MTIKFLLAWLVVFIVWMAGAFVIHAGLLQADYMALAQLYRTEADQQQHFAAMLIAHVIMAGAFVWIYERGIEAKPWLGQGLRYAVRIAALTVVPWYLIYFAVQPLPAELVTKQIVYDGILMLILGAVVAFMHRNVAPTA